MRQLSFEQASALLKKYDVRVVFSENADTAFHAAKIAHRIGFPVVLKLNSPDVIHKTEAGLVKTNIYTHEQLYKEYDDLMKKARKVTKNIQGAIVQKQLTGYELIIGAKRDAQFGPVMLFGLGGIFTELFEDVSVRIAPVSKKEARRMLAETKAGKLLSGLRGLEKADKEAVVQTITALSHLMLDHPEVMEVDLNPCFATKDACTAADLRIIVE